MPERKRGHDREGIRDWQIEKTFGDVKVQAKEKESPVQVVITCVNAIGSKSSEAKTTKQI